MMHTFVRPTERLIRSLVTLAGRDPAAFACIEAADGRIGIRGAQGVAFYAGEAWMSKFVRHLHRGFFDPAVARERQPEAMAY